MRLGIFRQMLGLIWRTRIVAVQVAGVAVLLLVIYSAFNLGHRSGMETAGNAPAAAAGDHSGHAGHADDQATTPSAETEDAVIWTCSMHPQIRQNEPGKCPLCGMDLVPEKITGGAESERQLVMSEAAKALAGIETVPVKREWVENKVSMVGLADYDETRLADVTAYVGGRLDRLYVDYTGVEVKKGDHMAFIYSPELLTAQAELLQAKGAYERLKNSTVVTIRESNRKALEAVRERLRLWGITEEQIKAIEERGTREDHVTIFAPRAGIVIKKHLQEGAYVKTGVPIYTIADLSKLWVQLKAYEDDLPWLRYGQDVTFTSQAHPGETFRGRISFIDPVLDKLTRTVNVRINVDNAESKLKPGMFVKAIARSRLALGGKVIDPSLEGKWICPMHPEIIKDGPDKCDICKMDLVPAEKLGYVNQVKGDPPLVIPVTAALVTGKRAIVYVDVPGREKPTYEGREVVLGARADKYYIVAHGLEEGERVVTRGAFRIDSALQIVAKPSVMNPGGGSAAGEHAQHGAGADAPPTQKKMTMKQEPIPVPDTFREKLAPLYAAYFDVHKALAVDDVAAAAAGTAALHKLVMAFDKAAPSEAAGKALAKQLEALAQAAAEGEQAKSLERARKPFKEVSLAVITLHQAFGHSGSETFYQINCSMAFDFKGADWLQTNKAVKNPYYGSEMLQCGEVKQTFKPGAPKSGAHSATKSQP